jgi:hypothetical protein
VGKVKGGGKLNEWGKNLSAQEVFSIPGEPPITRPTLATHCQTSRSDLLASTFAPGHSKYSRLAHNA